MRPLRESSIRAVVTGLAVTEPFGDVFWTFAPYLLGLHRMGHDVLYVEDPRSWCYDPWRRARVPDGAANASFFHRNLEALEHGVGRRWFYRDALGETYGLPQHVVRDFCSRADLLIDVAGSCLLRDDYLGAGTVAFVDSDPAPARAVPPVPEGSADGAREDPWSREHHDVFFTFAENAARQESPAPAGAWMPTRQPVVLECLSRAVLPAGRRRPVVTAMATLDDGGGIDALEGYLDLPSRSRLPLELALDASDAVEQRLRAARWRLRSRHEVSRDPWAYRRYVADCAAGWHVAGGAHVAARSGWFPAAAACYLALGVPVVVQDTGFGGALPTGEGVLACDDADGAAAAIETIATAPEARARAAGEIAAEHFAYDRVLASLVERALGSRSNPLPRGER